MYVYDDPEKMKNQRVCAVTDLSAVTHNMDVMRRCLKNETKICAVIKADAYGHGAVPIARLLEGRDDVWGFAVAAFGEALALREAGIRKPVLILGYSFPEDLEEMFRLGIRPAVFSRDMLLEASEAAGRTGMDGPFPVHLAVDTGMTRIGFPDTAESASEIAELLGQSRLVAEGLFTHFARADETDVTPALVQLERYERFAKLLEEKGLQIPLHHCSNSAGIIRMPQANMNMVRAGITIYGIYPSDEVEREPVPLKPAMELISHVSYVKDLPAGAAISYGGTYVTERPSRIATIPTGYADGYPRLLSNKGSVLIHGKRAPIRGRVCMDQFMVDVTDIPDVRRGDRVVLMGRDGDDAITADELGALSGRFPYELVCCISPRVPRVYL